MIMSAVNAKKKSLGEYVLGSLLVVLCALSLTWACLSYFAVTIALGDMLSNPPAFDMWIGYPMFVSVPLFLSAAVAQGARFYGKHTAKPFLQRISSIAFWCALVLGVLIVAYFEYTVSARLMDGSTR